MCGRAVLSTIILLGFAACNDPGRILQSAQASGQELLDTEQFGAVLGQVDSWLRLAEKDRDPAFIWRFRLMKAAALIGNRESALAGEFLDASGPPPSGSRWARERASWFLFKAQSAYYLADYGEVAVLLDRAMRNASEGADEALTAEIALQQAVFLMKNGKYSTAESAVRDVLDASLRQRNRYLEARTRNVRGVLLQSESRHDEAIPEFEASRKIGMEIGALDTAARADGNLGYTYYRLGDYDNALAHYESARRRFSQTGNRYEMQIWAGDAADVYFATDNLREAANGYKRALTLARGVNAMLWVGRWLNNMAAVSIEQADWKAAERYYREASDVTARTGDAANEGSTLTHAAQIAAGEGDLDRAGRLFAEALRKNAEDPKVSLAAHAGLARIHAGQGGIVQAESEFQKAIAEIEGRQSRLFADEYRFSWLDSLITFYQEYVDFLIDRKQPERALEAAESSRSKVLAGNQSRRETSQDYRQLSRRAGTVLLEYWLGPAHSYLWVVTPGRTFCHTLPPRAEMLPLIRSYRAVVAGGRNPLDVAPDTGAKLYNALLAPAMQDAGRATQFIVVPDDELYSLNFETLPDGPDASRYWVDRATIRIAPSLNYLAANMSAPHRAPAPRLLLIGDPESSLPQYPKLEFASREISAVSSAMAFAHPVAIQGAAATPASYAGSHPGAFGFIHFSAHAAAAPRLESALDSAVILSGPPDKCRLVAHDVLSIPLQAELVTVSACRSAGGKTYGGEGLVGFAWAFMKAGAANVIAGLWDVNDRSTVQLMTGLYSRIASGASPAEALRSAKLALIHGGGSYAKPFYWAPFEVYTARAD